MKYVIIKNSCLQECPIVFADVLQHSDVIQAHRVVSAGFCDLYDGKWQAWGKSVSLDKSSRPEDAEILQWHFREFV